MHSTKRLTPFRQVLFAVLACNALAAPATAQAPEYLNESLPFAQRARDLVARMTLAEKIGQMKDVAPAIDRLGIPAYNWWNEAI